MALIPPERLTDWTPGVYTGVPGGIPTDRTNLIDVTEAPYNADPTGVLDAKAAIQAAFDSSSEGDIIYLPTGTYRMDSGLSLGWTKINRTIRGDGMGLTTVQCYNNAGFADIGQSTLSAEISVVSGLTHGSSEIELGDATGITAGMLLKISWENQQDDAEIEAGAVPVVSVSGFEYLRSQTVRVTGVAGNDVSFFPEIYSYPDPGLSAVVQYSAFAAMQGIGFEDLFIDLQESTSFYGVWFLNCYRCWVKGVKIQNGDNYCVFFQNSLQCEVRENWLSDRKAGGTNGASILAVTVSGCLFENNVLANVFPVVEINGGASGNVIAFNLCENNPVMGQILFAIDSNHGPHNSFNLYEGNISPNLTADGYFGGCSEDTILSNWFHGSCYDNSSWTWSLKLRRFTRTHSMCGNILGKRGNIEGIMTFGYPFIGSDEFTGECEPTSGDFWVDWKSTATLSTRDGDFAGTITLLSGDITTAQVPITIYWNSKANSQTLTAGTVVGNDVPWTGGSGDALPVEGTVVEVFMGPNGYDQLDLDVENSLIEKGNYLFGTGGTDGSRSGTGGDPIPDSLFRSEPPSWWGGCPWPAIVSDDPDSVGYPNIPAGLWFLEELPLSAPEITSQCSVSGDPIQGQTLTANPGGVTGNPPPTRTWKWQRNGVDIMGATSITYLLIEDDVGFDVGPVQIETNTEGSDESVATPLTILAFTGDQIVVTQVANTDPVTELWRRGALTSGVSGPLEYYTVQHSGPYPTQPDNNYIYARFGTPQDNVYVFQGTISEAEAIASVP